MRGLSEYSGISPKGDLILIHKISEKYAGRSFLHVNSTRSGGGVAEILQRAVPLMNDIGINTRWEVIEGDPKFFEMTKKVHNALQGNKEDISAELWRHHMEINAKNAEALDLGADCVLIHDPQPAPLVKFKKNGKWMWRCHIDVSEPMPAVWERLRAYVESYDAAIFSVSKFSKPMPIEEYIVPPSIDPLSDKNREMDDGEINAVLEKHGIPADKPMMLQVSRFDVFKDPIGVINAYRMVKRYNDCTLVLAGGTATDDPEGEQVLAGVRENAAGDPDIHIVLLPPFSDKEVNALQRAAAVVLQKSVKEGFGLTVSEAMWKEKPVIGGAVGGIPLQIVHGVTGYLVRTVEGAAFRIRQLLNNPEMASAMGKNGKEYVRRNFLITRQIRDYLSLWVCLENKGSNMIELL